MSDAERARRAIEVARGVPVVFDDYVPASYAGVWLSEPSFEVVGAAEQALVRARAFEADYDAVMRVVAEPRMPRDVLAVVGDRQAQSAWVRDPARELERLLTAPARRLTVAEVLSPPPLDDRELERDARAVLEQLHASFDPWPQPWPVFETRGS